MYELVSLKFPFANDSDKNKPRPGFVISQSFGEHKQKSLIKLHRLGTFQPNALKEGQGKLPKELVSELQMKLKKVFLLQ